MTPVTHEEVVKANLAELARARAREEEAKLKQDEMIEALKNSAEWLSLQGKRDNAREHKESLEAEIKAEALATFTATGTKKQEGVTIKEFTVVKISDESQAREWCMTNFRPALKLDTKTFEKAAQDGTVPAELATVTTEPRAQIATDLSKYLPSAIPGPEQSR